jgi:hypothetical protein
MKRFALATLSLFACGLVANAQGQEVAFFQDAAPNQPTPVTDTLDARLQALEAEAQDLKPTLEEHTQRITKIEDGIKADKEKAAAAKAADAKKDKKWYEKLSIRGYTQVRINEVFDDNDSPADPHYVGDSSIGENQSFLLRRMRVIIFGDINEHVYVYLQPDFAANVPGSTDANQFTQLRDAYADLYVDKDKEFRFRVGQSKIPYGWENLQSSQNRLPLDRNDALNSAARNERDLGVFFYYTPKDVQDLFKEISDKNLKGSGNYGMFALGAYNGQGGSFREQNDNLHVISRFALPFYMGDEQIVEVGVQGYIGKYTVLSSLIDPPGPVGLSRPTGTLETDGRDGIHDKRLAWTFVYYPQPFGFQSEWTIGRGPSLNDAQTEVIDRSLYGGYAMIMYRMEFEDNEEIIPFARWNYYKGGYKSERNAPYSEIKEWEMGVEWQINKAAELVTMYTITDRTNTTAISTAGRRSYEQFEGGILRFQLQFNY